MASKIVVNLDTSKENHLVAKCKQNDDLILEANIYENNLEKDLTNCSISIQALKSDRTYIIQNTDITNSKNKITAKLVKDFTRVAGATNIEVVLIESGKQNTTFSFHLEVVNSVIKGAVESTNTVTILEELENKIVEAGAVKEETEQLIENGGAATTGQVKEITASLEQITNKELPFIRNKEYGQTSKNIQPIVTFLDDDGTMAVWNKLKPIFESKGVPFTTCIISGSIGGTYNGNQQMTLEQLKYLQNNMGCEISSHTVNHKMLDIECKNIQERDYEISESKKQLNNLGLNCSTLVYPGGHENEEITDLARKYYNCSVTCDQGYNRSPIETHRLTRYFIDDDIVTLDYLKARVDNIISNSGWLILGSHVWYSKYTEAFMPIFSDIIDYIKSKSIPIVTLEKGYQMYKNTIDIGNRKTLPYFRIGANGKVASNFEFRDTIILDKNSKTATSTPSDFPINKVSMCALDNSQPLQFPLQKAGVLTTYNIDTGGYWTYQTWTPTNLLNKVKEYKRIWIGTGWSAWKTVLYGEGKKWVRPGFSNSVPANSVESINYNFEGCTVDDTVVINPIGANINANIQFYANVSTNNTIRIICKNGTSNVFDASTVDFNINIINN